MRSLSRTASFYIAGLLISVAGLLLVIESTTRLISWAGGDGFTLALHERDATDEAITDIYRFHPFTGFVFKPRRKLIGGHPAQETQSEILINDHGFLSDRLSMPLEKAEDEIRIATIGASTTANLNLNYEDNWPGKLGALLQSEFPDKKVTVINAGIPGFNTAQSIGNLTLRVLPFSPDVVIIYHAYNDLKLARPNFDLKPDLSNVHTQPYGTHKRPGLFQQILDRSMFFVRMRNKMREYEKMTAALEDLAGENRLDRVPEGVEQVFRHNMLMMIAAAQAAGAKVILSSFATLHDPDSIESQDLRTLSPLKRQELAALLQFTPGLNLAGIFEGLRRYNTLLAELARSMAAGWVDNAALVPHDDQFFVDRVHFSVAGAGQMANNFFPAVVAAINDDATAMPPSTRH